MPIKIVGNITINRGREIGTGQGRNSHVYLSDDPQLGGQLAVKVIKKNIFPNMSNYFSEANALFASQHDNVVPINYACHDKDSVFLAMPYFQRGSLADRIGNKSLNLREVIRVGLGILNGVRQIHVADFLHFDLKPSNVLFSNTDVPLIADFGQSRSIGPSGITMRPEKLYTLGMAPEVITTNNGTTESDVYQVALTLYRAVNGDPVFLEQMPLSSTETRQMIKDGTLPDRDRFLPHVPRALKAVIVKGLRCDPAKRFATAAKFSSALNGIAGSENWIDWTAFHHSNRHIQWKGIPNGRSEYQVDLKDNGRRWNVTIHRNTKRGQQRFKRDELWRDQLTFIQSMKHLKTVFTSL